MVYDIQFREQRGLLQHEPVAKLPVLESHEGNALLASLLTALAKLRPIMDSTTA